MPNNKASSLLLLIAEGAGGVGIVALVFELAADLGRQGYGSAVGFIGIGLIFLIIAVMTHTIVHLSNQMDD